MSRLTSPASWSALIGVVGLLSPAGSVNDTPHLAVGLASCAATGTAEAATRAAMAAGTSSRVRREAVILLARTLAANGTSGNAPFFGRSHAAARRSGARSASDG